MRTQSLPNTTLIVDLETATIRPESPDGDDFYGLAMGTNGTAATVRRELAVEALKPCTPSAHVERLTWVRSDGRGPIGLWLVPNGRSHEFENPWISSERE